MEKLEKLERRVLNFYNKVNEAALIINVNKCTGCRICELICSLRKEGSCSAKGSMVRVLKLEEKGVDLPLLCIHCSDPPCAPVCPTTAINKDVTGAILVDETLCSKCELCLTACPIEAIKLDPETGKLIKCDLCNGEVPCAIFCPTGAISLAEPEPAKNC
jgi:Fe-S-cluster-containing hydrogenase component 2